MTNRRTTTCQRSAWRCLALACFLCLAAGSASYGQKTDGARMLGGVADFRIERLPPGAFRERLERLPPAAAQRAEEWLRGFAFPEADVASLNVDEDGGICYACSFPHAPHDEPYAADGTIDAADGFPVTAATLPVSPFPDSLAFSSRPGSQNTIFLNFGGAVISGTAWNLSVGRDPIPATAFSLDSDFTTFSDAEQAAIGEIWRRVAEDYAPFDVNVTTAAPTSWSRTAHVLITRNTDVNGAPNPSSGAGGVAYVNIFGSPHSTYYSPAWAYYNNVSSTPSRIAEVASHETGHNMGLSHDGQIGGTEYYSGHGSGELSWGAIMGAGYWRNVTQWSKGEYYLANNTQDDVAIMAGLLGYRPDDHGGTTATASHLELTDGTNIVSTTPLSDPYNEFPANKGTLARSGDVDMFVFTTGAGPISLRVNPWVEPSGARGGNLDLKLRLLAAGGAVVASAAPQDRTGASIETTLDAGVYYIEVTADGAGLPTNNPPSGYTDYGSLGQYFLSGWVTDPFSIAIPPGALARRIARNSDDAQENSGTSGAVDLTNTRLNISYAGSAYWRTGLRFQNLDIPPDAVITNAFIQFISFAASTGGSLINAIRAEASDNAGTFASTSRNLRNRPRTTASVTWSLPVWTAPDLAGPAQRTPDLSALVQEVIARPGWAAGNAIAFIFDMPTTHANRPAYSFDGNPDAAPLLLVQFHIPEYTPFDRWRLDHWGSLSGPKTGPSDDYDGDGFDNWQEYLADTDPADSTSFFPPLTLAFSGSNVVLGIEPSSTARMYHVDMKTPMLEGGWSPLTNALGTGAAWTQECPLTETGPLFFRGRVTLP